MKKRLSQSLCASRTEGIASQSPEPAHSRPQTVDDRDALLRLGDDGGIAYDDDAEIG